MMCIPRQCCSHCVECSDRLCGPVATVEATDSDMKACMSWRCCLYVITYWVERCEVYWHFSGASHVQRHEQFKMCQNLAPSKDVDFVPNSNKIL